MPDIMEIFDLDFTHHEDEKLEKYLNAVSQELYQRNRRFTPLYPWVFVRVLEREQQRSGIWVPGAVQNKVVHEGLVIATWLPRQKDCGCDRVSSELKIGDHVLFQHFAGVPIEGYDRDRYRVVRECDWDPANEGGIFATVEYGGLNITQRMSHHLKKSGFSHTQADKAVREIYENCMLIPRDMRSVTLSGK